MTEYINPTLTDHLAVPHYPDNPTRGLIEGILALTNAATLPRLEDALSAAGLTPEQRARFDAAWMNPDLTDWEWVPGP